MVNIMKIKNLTFTIKQDPEVIDLINKIACADQRKPHDAARRLILEAAKSKLNSIREMTDKHSVA